MSLLHLTTRDRLVLEALSLRVRLIGLRQLADALWFGQIANARRRMKRLTVAELVRRETALARPLPDMHAPVCQWQPGQAEPDAGEVSHRLQTRWRYSALRTTVVYLPTEFTVSYFGGRQRHGPLTTQVTHDLGVTAIWLWFVRHQPKLAATWQGEDLIAPLRRGETLPDAVLAGPDGEPALLIEFGGSYRPRRVAAFHDDAALRGLPYQIW